MKLGVFGLSVLAAGLRCAAGSELAGTWEGTFTTGATTMYAGFDLDVTGDRITGAAYVQGWGYSSVTDGRVENGRVRFTVARKFSGDGRSRRLSFMES